MVAGSEGLVHGTNKAINQPSHVRGERIKRGSTGTGAFEVSVLVVFSAEEALLTGGDVEIGGDGAQLGHQ